MEAVRDYPRVTCRSANGVGKDWTAATLALWFLYANAPEAIVITTAPTNRQIESVLWGEIRRKHANAKIHLGGECLTRSIKLGPKHFAIGFSTDEESQFQGWHSENVLIIFSEAQGISPIIYNAAKGCLTNNNARWLLIGNPLSPMGEFYNSFKSEAWHKLHISALDSPNVKAGRSVVSGVVTKQWVDDRKLEWGDTNPLYQARVLGDFPTESDDTLISLTNIEQAKDKPMGVTGNRVLGIDVARYGADESVVCDFDGYTAKFPIKLRGKSITELSGQIIEYLRNNPVAKDFNRGQDWKVFVDDVGLGGGLTDILTDQGYDVEGIISNARAQNPEMFADVRMEAYWTLAERFRQGTVQIPNDEKLVGQLAGLKYEHTLKGQKRLVSKEKLRAEGIESPDRADSLALSSWGHKFGGRKGTLKLNFDHMMGSGRGGY